MTITSLDGYRWLKNDIIRGNFQPDEKLRMSLLTSRYARQYGSDVSESGDCPRWR